MLDMQHHTFLIVVAFIADSILAKTTFYANSAPQATGGDAQYFT